MSLKKIDSNIKLICTNAAKLNGRIHETAVMIASHANEHGDCTRALALVKAMPASMRRTMLVLWFNTFTPIRVSVSNDKVGILKADSPKYVAYDLEGAAAKPFYELAAEKAEETDTTLDDVNEAVARLIKRITTRVDEDKVAANDKDAIVARIAALKAFAA